MNILMISHYAGSPMYGMEYRSYYMAKKWVDSGHNVFIVGADYSHLRNKQPNTGHEVIDGIKYLWLHTNKYQSNGIRRILSMVSFILQVYRHTKEMVAFRPDIVIASSVYTFDIFPCHSIAKKCLYKWGIKPKLVYEVHDLWPLSPMEIGGFSPRHPFIWLVQHGEDYSYKHCDKVVSMLWNAEEHMREHGLKKGKFIYIPNGYSKEEWGNDAENIKLPDEHKNFFESHKDKTIVGLVGGFAASDALDTMIEAAEQLRNYTSIHFVLVGNGPEKEHLQHLINVKKLTNFTILSPVPKKIIPAIIKHFDIAYMSGVHSVLHKYGTSFNKLTDYMLSRKPIIQALDEPNSLVERLGCGIRIEAENSSQVALSILKLYQMDDSKRQSMGNIGYQYAKEHLEWSTLSDEMLKQIMN